MPPKKDKRASATPAWESRSAPYSRPTVPYNAATALLETFVPASEEKKDNDPEFIYSLAKGLAVIASFGEVSPSMTLSQIATKVGLSPGSARRVLVTLKTLGYVDYDADNRRYSLAAATLQLGYSYLSSLPALNLLQPRLVELADKLNESCSLMLRSGRDVVCVARATARRLDRDYMSVGSRYPAHASSSGKILLGALSPSEFNTLYLGEDILPPLTPYTVRNVAGLRVQVDAARDQGWAFIDQETALGIASVAVPLKVAGQIRYGLSTSSTLTKDHAVFMDTYLPELIKTAAVLEKLISSTFR